ncbi:ABC transporter permease [Microbacterium sorbitolivorans]|uniref:Sugar ABC transporter permease n=1 Tax=Microbacterium sorbitolivorans TaxID=1867410 RepID=A0A367Y2S3_9MICO|nr:sugar ABC transporter permease [Microbacterium sorbitolivorans]RCK60196.1 sugar ABC transporter permease [Microbacterium sorbitolivorans]GGF48712.1 ABC transporter permease [Microbacterium sorbitolivorans]
MSTPPAVSEDATVTLTTGGRGRRPHRGTASGRQLLTALTPYLFVAVAVGLLMLLTYAPAANMIWYSLNNWTGFGKVDDFVGLDNYIEVFTNPKIFAVFGVSLYYFVASFVQMAIALYFAALLSFSTRFSNFFRGILFFPYLINGVAIGFVFLYLFQPGGTLDTVLGWFGLADPPQWLGDSSIANFSLASTSVWRYTGLNFVLFLGAIQSIPSELYEAAELDGAGKWAQFRFIIFPGIRRIIGLSFILAISGSLSVFEIPYIMTSGANGTSTFVIQTVQTAFQFRQVGLASAMAVILLAIVLIVTWLQRKFFPDEKVDLT